MDASHVGAVLITAAIANDFKEVPNIYNHNRRN